MKIKINKKTNSDSEQKRSSKKTPASRGVVLARSEKEAKNQKEAFPSELRQDLVTGDWVVIATGRGRRPFDGKKVERAFEPEDIPKEEDCIFCDPVRSAQEEDVLIYNTSDGGWSLRVFPNKYPAFARPQGGKVQPKEEGPYFLMSGVGYHEVIVARDHHQHIGKMNPLMVAEVLDSYQSRYIDLMNKKSVRYIEIFHNHGKAVGGSIYHPHSQLAAIPVISPYIKLELDGAEQYHRSHKKCVFCTINEWELEHRKRVVFENDLFVAFCPFASRAAFEIWVMPKKHKPYFERSGDDEKIQGGEALREAIGKISKVLGEPAYNFYLHTSPCDGKDYPHYHWHIEILPKTSTWAGFELSTGIEISSIKPEDAASLLREAQ